MHMTLQHILKILINSFHHFGLKKNGYLKPKWIHLQLSIQFVHISNIKSFIINKFIYYHLETDGIISIHPLNLQN